MDIFEHLDDMQQHLFTRSSTEIEQKYHNLCSQLADEKTAKEIHTINLNEYQKELEKGLVASIILAENNAAKAIYFEYDLDNNWDSHFFICDNYNPPEDQDDDWACDWSNSIDGPILIKFAEIYSENGFDSSEKAMGITLYLLARTIVAFANACKKADSKIPICIAFHDQDPIMRIGGE
ncbi:hypothetical protein [Aneurinibacillus sp. REN35]|uniref:hypothetical protein n=1 Tax=Aneurinibacillus sp. REN35 TaxID=3237286 RepID=UPI00352786C5